MNINVGDTVLITTDNWFFAPDGREYKAVAGVVKRVIDAETALGIKTNARSTNWYVEIGNMLLAGCQIHYAVKTDYHAINFGETPNTFHKEGEPLTFACRIYDAGL